MAFVKSFSRGKREKIVQKDIFDDFLIVNNNLH